MPYDVQISPIPPPADLLKEWQALNAKTQPNCFLSWPWIDTWLQNISVPVFIIRIFEKSEVIALGLLCKRRKTAWLHQTGQQQDDQIWIEYNSLLAETKHQDAALSALLTHLKTKASFSKLVISGAPQTLLENTFKQHDISTHRTWSAPTFYVDLNALKSKTQNDYLASLSRNTRYQIRKAAKHCQLQLECADTQEQAFDFFSDCSIWHRERWSHTQEGSGFDNPNFAQFHTTLIASHFKHKAIHVWRLKAEDQVVAYAYNLIDKNHAFFYLSAIDYKQGILSKPGMVLHSLMIQRYIDMGFARYDFMGGDAQYKRSLGIEGPALAGYEITCATPLERLKQTARNWKHRLRESE